MKLLLKKYIIENLWYSNPFLTFAFAKKMGKSFTASSL